MRFIKTIGLLLVVTVLVGLIDTLTGYELNFFVFYFLPVAYAAWLGGRVMGAATSILCGGVWLWGDIVTGHVYQSAWYGFWNAGIRLISFLLLSYVVTRVRDLLRREQELTAELQATLSQVKELSGLLPICASCKKIRNDKGYWEQMESYVQRYSKAQFSHGLCPPCAHKLYPEHYDQQGGDRQGGDAA